MDYYNENDEIDLSNDDANDNTEFVDDDTDEEEDMIKQNEIFDEPVISNQKPKRKLSEEHKAKLQAGRLKALENRRENSRKNKEMKELHKKKKDLEYEHLQKEVDDLEYENPIVNGKNKFNTDFADTYNLSEEQLIDIQEKAVANYDNKRKERKKLKKQAENDKNIRHVVEQAQSNIDNAWMRYIPQ